MTRFVVRGARFTESWLRLRKVPRTGPLPPLVVRLQNEGGARNRRLVPFLEEWRRAVSNNTVCKSEVHMKQLLNEEGATGYILLWLLGIPIPVLLVFFLLRGCT